MYKEWFKAALIRAVRTFAEAALAYIGTGALVLKDVNWIAVLSAGAFGFVTAMPDDVKTYLRLTEAKQ